MAIRKLQGYELWAKIVVANPDQSHAEFVRSLGLDPSKDCVIADGHLFVNADQTTVDNAFAAYDFTTTKTTIKWQEVKAARDKLLRDTDWTQLPDSPVDVAAFAAYRQALRDLPAQQSDPFNITWPVKPAVQ